MIFKTKGFVHTDKSAHYVSEISFNLDKELSSLKFEFFGGGKQLFFHVKDPSGLLRVQHQSSTEPSNVLLHEDEPKSAIGTCPGRIRKGEWKITVFTYAPRFNRMWGEVPFEVKVLEGKEDSDNRSENYVSWIKSDGVEKGKLLLNYFEPENIDLLDEKWLSGDFHVHSMLSDGSATPLELLDEGISKNLDFFFITEHNILATGFPQKKGITVFPSYEVTTAIGHFNACGLRYVPEWFLSKGPAPSWNVLEKLIKDFRGKGVLVSINHPFMVPWQWQYNDLPLSWIDSIEVISDPYDKNAGDSNEKAITLIDILWNNGFRITGIGGSDTHTKFSASKLGQPVTKIYAKPGSLFSMLEGVKKHRAEIFLDLNCAFNYMSKGKVLLPGTDIGSSEDVPLEFSLSLDGESDPVSLRVIENGNIVEEKKALSGEKCVIERVWKGNSSWIRCEIRDIKNRIRGYINPLHRGKQKRTIETWGDALDLLNSRF